MDFNYESPITKITQEITSQIVKTEEKELTELTYEIKKAIGYSIEKEELIKALQYDRQQYDKGYQDGLNANKWIPVKERLPEPQEYGDKDYSDWVQVTLDIGRNDNDVYVCEAYYCFSENKWYAKRFSVGEITAWQPLPKPYKAESEVEE